MKAFPTFSWSTICGDARVGVTTRGARWKAAIVGRNKLRTRSMGEN